MYQISNCTAFILYEHDVSIGNIRKRNIAFVFAVLFLQLMKRKEPMEEWVGRGGGVGLVSLDNKFS